MSENWTVIGSDDIGKTPRASWGGKVTVNNIRRKFNKGKSKKK